VGDAAIDNKKEAIVWLTAEKSLSKKVVQVSKTFQEACGFKLGDDLCISAAGQLSTVETVVLRDITANEEGTPELGEADRPHWEWFLRESLGRSFFPYWWMLSVLGRPRRLLTKFQISQVVLDNQTIFQFETKGLIKSNFSRV